MSIITLTTDFGRRDHYVACMKGVIMQLAPQARIVDVTHEIDRHDILAGAFILRETIPWYPAGTVHVAIVDPGVGTPRRIIAARYAGHYVIAPDNGLISLVHQQLAIEEVRVVEDRRFTLPTVSRTFHGRDVLAPTAARLATGANLREVGPPADHVEVLQLPKPRWLNARAVQGQVIHIDHFGNLITNIGGEDVSTVYRHHPGATVVLGDHSIGSIRGAYADVPVGEAIALIGSSGLLEISVNAGSAAERFHPAPGEVVLIH